MPPLTWEGSLALRQLLDKVLESGMVRIKCEEKKRAQRVRQQLHEARALDRTNSEEMYDPSDERYGKSPYDKIVTEIEVDPKTRQATLVLTVAQSGLAGVLSIEGPDGEEIKL